MAVWIKDKKGQGSVSENDFNNLQNSFNTLNSKALVTDNVAQTAAGLKLSSQNNNDNDVVIMSTIIHKKIVDTGGGSKAANTDHEFTPDNFTFDNGFYTLIVSALVGSNDNTFMVCGRKLGNKDSITAVMNIPTATNSTTYNTFVIRIKQNGHITVRCNNAFAYLLVYVNKIQTRG